MGKRDSDKKLNRFSTTIEIITNLGTIASWVLALVRLMFEYSKNLHYCARNRHYIRFRISVCFVD
jgi:hypothetical protein